MQRVQNLRVYLDTCCVNRLFDVQMQARVQRETQAIIQIIDRFLTRQWQWLGSEVLEDEVSADSNPDRRAQVRAVMEHVYQTFSVTAREEARGEELEVLRFKHYDALHIACAESGEADILLTTDDRMLRLAKRHRTQLRVHVENPYTWLQEMDSGQGASRQV